MLLKQFALCGNLVTTETCCVVAWLGFNSKSWRFHIEYYKYNTWNWFSNPLLPGPSFLSISTMAPLSSWAIILVSPQVMWSLKASWMKAYWSNVCTICFLLVLISLTNSKMLRSSLSFSLSIIASRVMKVPVRPTPALEREMNLNRIEWGFEVV